MCVSYKHTIMSIVFTNSGVITETVTEMQMSLET